MKRIIIAIITVHLAVGAFVTAQEAAEDVPEVGDFLQLMEKAYRQGEKEIEIREKETRRKSASGIPLIKYMEEGDFSGRNDLLLHSFNWSSRKNKKSLFSLPVLSTWSWDTNGPGWGFFFVPALSGVLYKNSTDDGSTVSSVFCIPLVTGWAGGSNARNEKMQGVFSLPLFTMYISGRDAGPGRLRFFASLPLLSAYMKAADNRGQLTYWGCGYLLSQYSRVYSSKRDSSHVDMRLLELCDVPLLFSYYSGFRHMNLREEIEGLIKWGAPDEYRELVLEGLFTRENPSIIKRKTLAGRIFKKEDGNDDKGTMEINPLFSYNYQPGQSSFTLSPLMMRITTTEKDVDCSFDPWKIWPVLYRTEDGNTTEVIWPLFQKKKTPYESSVKLRPVFSLTKRPTDETRVFNMLGGLLLHDRSYPGMYLAETGDSGTRYEACIKRRTSLLGGLLYKRKSSKSRTSLSIGTSLLYHHTTDTVLEKKEIHLTPLIKYRNMGGKRSVRLLGIIKIPLS